MEHNEQYILFSHFDSNDHHDYTRILLVDTKGWITNQDQVNTDNRPLSTRTLTGSLVHFFARARGLLKVQTPSARVTEKACADETLSAGHLIVGQKMVSKRTVTRHCHVIFAFS